MFSPMTVLYCDLPKACASCQPLLSQSDLPVPPDLCVLLVVLLLQETGSVALAFHHAWLTCILHSVNKSD